MTFAQKLIFLMQLTSTTNKQLADAIKVDPSLISLMRTGRREPSKSNNHAKTIAAYFAKKSEGNYQRIALSEAMGRKHMQMQMDVEQLSAVLFDWLTDSRDQVGQFLSTFERFTIRAQNAGAEPGEPSAAPKGDAASFMYYGNEGKRGAISAFVEHLLSLHTTGTILLSIDESPEWLFEAPEYLAKLQEQLMTLLQKGFRVRRIAAPLSTADQAFDSLSRWLPLYMTGNVESYFYPRLRDDLYRRTMIALPGEGAVISMSSGGQTVTRATMFTLSQRLTAAIAGDFEDLLQKCRPMMTTYTNAVRSDEIARCISQFESDRGNRIQQSSTLSSITSPPELLRRATEGMPADEAAAMLSVISEAQGLFRQSLARYEAVDIHSLASPDDVRAGVVPVAASYLRPSTLVRYTPKTYALHLQSILDHMQEYQNYRAVLLPHNADIHALMVKEGRQALLLRPGTPLMIFEVSHPSIAEACREYLLRLVDTPLSPAMQRRETMATLQKAILELTRE